MAENQVLNSQDIENIAKETVEVIQPRINYDFQKIVTIVKNNQSILEKLIASSEKKEYILTDIEKAQIKIIYLNIIKLRQALTGQIYQLSVGLENGTTINVTLDELANNEHGSIVVKGNQIEYSLDLVDEQLDKVDDYNEQYKKLTDFLFPTSDPTGMWFQYRHSKGKGDKSIGNFYISKNIAKATKETSETDRGYYYYSLIGQREQHIYTSSDTKQYNRGHVYEWFLSDINKKSEPPTNPDTFMKDSSHKRDNVQFLKGGDTRIVGRNNIIYAVQIKKINNKKLLTYKQINNTLKKLSALDSKKSQAKNARIVKNAFLTRQRSLNEGAYAHVDKVIKELKTTGFQFS